MLIRGIPQDVLAALDVKAERMGLSRTELVRRRLVQEARSEEPVTVEQLRKFGEEFADLADEQVMADAWR